MFFVVEYLMKSTIKGLGKYLQWPNFPKLFILSIVEKLLMSRVLWRQFSNFWTLKVEEILSSEK